MDIINRRKNDHKKTLSLAAIEFAPGDIEAGVAGAMCMLPSRCIVTAVYAVTETDHDMGDLTIESVDADEVADSILAVTSAQGTVGIEANLLADPVMTGPGMRLFVTPSAEMTVGSTTVLIEYMEPTLSNGKLTAVQ